MLRAQVNKLSQIVESRQRTIDGLTKVLENSKSKDYKLVKADSKQDVQNLKPKS